ncbi:FAD binding domain-containing protein, partial [Chloroflexota bacterium]
GNLRIGALTTLRSIELSPLVRKYHPVLFEAISSIASIQVKSMGTAVGNLCVATPASDVALALTVLGAQLKISGTTTDKTVSIEDFYTGVNRTILQPGDIVSDILIPECATGTGSAFLKLVTSATDIAKVNVAVAITLKDHNCRQVKIALGSVAPTVIRAGKAEETLTGNNLTQDLIDAASKIAAEETKPITDIRSTAEYRQEVAGVLVKRAIEKALARIN